MDVVVAPATASGRAALALVRYSGPGLLDRVAEVVRLRGGSWRSGRALRVDLHDGQEIFDDGVAVFRRGPATFTGEDTLEITCHGNPQIVDRLVRASIAAGCRMATPGEFTRRAVVNGKIDLVAAEAVEQAIRATSDDGLRIARAALDGRLGAFLAESRGRMVEVCAELEARMDWPADELAYEADEALVASLTELAARCRELARTADRGRVWVEGARVALVGSVNAGKSSLFNALLGRERALVHETAGTTRDVVEAPTSVDGVAVTLLDTAGERETSDPVEAAGLALAQELVAEADALVVVLRARPSGISATEAAILERTAGRRRLVVCNGVDADEVTEGLPVSARTGQGVEALKQALRGLLVGEATGAETLAIASQRQADLLEATARACEEAVEALPIAGVAVAADALTHGIAALDALTGADTREQVLDAVFARFCIGK